MKQQEFKSLIEKTDEYDVKKCDWCNVWKPPKDMRQAKMFGTEICTNCFYNFYKISTSIDHAEPMLNWLIRNLQKRGVVVEVSRSISEVERSEVLASSSGG